MYILGTIAGVIQGDTRNLDYGSYGVGGVSRRSSGISDLGLESCPSLSGSDGNSGNNSNKHNKAIVEIIVDNNTKRNNSHKSRIGEKQ